MFFRKQSRKKWRKYAVGKKKSIPILDMVRFVYVCTANEPSNDGTRRYVWEDKASLQRSIMQSVHAISNSGSKVYLPS